jgi:hypothetical protein
MLLYTTNFDGVVAEQQTQQFFCHIGCLRTSMNRATPVYVLEDPT